MGDMERIEQERRNLEKLKDVLAVARETEAIGADTCVALHQQGQQLNRIYEKNQEIEHNIKQGNRIVRGMSGFMGRVKNLFSKKPKISKKEEVVGPTPSQRNPGVGVWQKTEIRNEEDALDEISDSISSIRNMAVNIGQALDQQNRKLDEVHKITDQNNEGLKKLDYRTKRLMW